MIKKILILSFISGLFFTGCDNKTAGVSGQGFLMTKGGLSRTCAGKTVYLEKSSLQGYAEAKDKITIFKDKLHMNEEILNSDYELIPKLNKDIAKYEDSEELERILKEAEESIEKLEEDNAEIEDELEALEFEIVHLDKSNVKKTTCDSQGNFQFNKLEKGKYYLSTTVVWFVGNEKQGGIISKTITVKDETNKVMLTE